MVICGAVKGYLEQPAPPTQRHFLSGIRDGINKRSAPRVYVFVVKSGEKGVEPLTFGFGDHCSTIGTILLKKKVVLGSWNLHLFLSI